MEVIGSRWEAIASRVEAIAIRNKENTSIVQFQEELEPVEIEWVAGSQNGRLMGRLREDK